MWYFRCVEPEYASIAGMFGSASIVTGIIAGIGCSYLMPKLISTEALDFDIPEWWPAYTVWSMLYIIINYNKFIIYQITLKKEDLISMFNNLQIVIGQNQHF